MEIYKKDFKSILDFNPGSKVKNKVKIPQWIFQNKRFLATYMRGLFDTDRCCYQTGDKYKIINFRNNNGVLVDDVFKALRLMGFHPCKRNGSVELGRQAEIGQFFNLIRPKNLKHYRFVNMPG